MGPCSAAELKREGGGCARRRCVRLKALTAPGTEWCGTCAFNSPPPLDIHPSFCACHPHPSTDASRQHRPARPLNATSHSLRVPRTSPARAQPTRGLRTHGAHGRPRANTLAAATRARTRRGPRPRPPLPTGVWRVRAHAPTCTCPSQPGVQRPQHHVQVGPQSGRPPRPQAEVRVGFGKTGDRAGNSGRSCVKLGVKT